MSTPLPPISRTPSAKSREPVSPSMSNTSRKSVSPYRKDSPTRSQKSKNVSPKPGVKRKNSSKKLTSASSSKMDRSVVRSGRHPSGDVNNKGLRLVDMSGQGMTSVPLHVTSKKDTGELNLSSNNLRILPAEIQRLVNLEKLDISKNGLRCVGPEDYSGIPVEFANLVYLQELRISECNLPFIPPAIWKLCNLKILDLSRNKINLLVPDVGNLIALRKLNLQQTNITSLPPEIACCQDLEEILLWGNTIESLPDTLPEMPKLRRLAINYRSFGVGVDQYMENLYRKGQIRSEHIPPVVFELPRLDVLDLENTKINNLPDIANDNLQELHLAKNYLHVVPESIYQLTSLHTLDLSHNTLYQLPDDIGYLIGLKYLKLNNNQFERIPASLGKLTQLVEVNFCNNRIRRIPSEICELVNLKSLLIANNNLQSLPDSICQLTRLETLDLTNNSLKTLPMKLYQLTNLTECHTYQKLHKFGLWLYQNPLETPPPEIWRCDKPEPIFEYLKTQHIVRTENLQRQKILVFGDSQCGKTSLVYSLMYNKSFLTKPGDDQTKIVKQTLWRTENTVQFLLNDFGGDRTYWITYPLFLDLKALVFLVYDSSRFTESSYPTMIGRWVDMLVANAPGAVIKIIGTKSDLTSSYQRDKYDDQKDTILHLVQTQLKTYYKNLTDELTNVEREVEIIQASQSSVNNLRTEAEDAILKLLQVRQRKLIELKTCQLRVMPKISIVTSAEGIDGISDLISDLELLAIDQSLFPYAQRAIPECWVKFRAELKRHKAVYLLWDKVEEIAKKHGVKEDQLEDCIQHFHDTGDVLWYSEIPGISEILFQRPRELINLLSSLFRHDIYDYLNYKTERLFSNKGNLSEEEFTEVRERFLLCGQVSRPLLNCLLFYRKLDQDGLTDMLELLPLLDLCYTIPEPDVPTGQLYSWPIMVIPSYSTDIQTDEIQNVWSEKPENDEKEASVIYTFPFHNTHGLFAKCAATIQDIVLTRMDWKTAVFATTDEESLLIREGLDIQGSVVIKLSVRGANFGSILELLTDLVQVINALLIRHPGIYWKIDFPMKNNEFLSKIATTPDVKFENIDNVLTYFSSSEKA